MACVDVCRLGKGVTVIRLENSRSDFDPRINLKEGEKAVSLLFFKVFGPKAGGMA